MIVLAGTSGAEWHHYWRGAAGLWRDMIGAYTVVKAEWDDQEA